MARQEADFLGGRKVLLTPRDDAERQVMRTLAVTTARWEWRGRTKRHIIPTLSCLASSHPVPAVAQGCVVASYCLASERPPRLGLSYCESWGLLALSSRL